MATRDELFRKFGPKLLEAIVDFLLELNNDLREEQGMPIITKEQYMALLNNHISDLPDYDWMAEEGEPP